MREKNDIAARAMLSLAATASEQLKGPRFVNSGPEFHSKTDFARWAKISSEEAFITAGLSEESDKYLAAIMRRLNPRHIGEKGNEWEVAAKCSVPFETAMEAKLDASKQFPLVAVLSDDGKEFTWPGYTEQIERRAKILSDSAEKQRLRNERVADRMIKGRKK